MSPALSWGGLPALTRSVALLIEDADPPLPVPLCHGVSFAIPASLHALDQGAVPHALGGGESPLGFHAGRTGFGRTGFGRTGFGRTGYLPPSPPPGHGPHHHAFQVFALDIVPVFERVPTPGLVLQRIRGHVIGRGTLFGIDERLPWLRWRVPPPRRSAAPDR